MKISPVNEILGNRMSPGDVAPHGGVTVVLVEQMVPSLVEEWTVGVVHPILLWLEVEFRAVRLAVSACTGSISIYCCTQNSHAKLLVMRRIDGSGHNVQHQ